MSKEHWDKSFSDEEFVYGEKENEFLNEMSYLFGEKATLACFAEGEGRNAVYLAKKGHNVTAYDQSTVGLQKTIKLANKNDVAVKVVEKDLVKETVDVKKYDGAVMIYGHVPKVDQRLFLQNIFNSVKDGGHIVIEVYSNKQIPYKTGGPRSLDMLYDPREVLKWIEDFKCIHFYYGEAERYEGKRHLGRGHVIQVAIKK